MSRKSIVPIGQGFGFLTVVGYAGSNKNGKSLVKCTCDCGNNTICLLGHLKNGNTKSCGCIALKNKYKAIKNDVNYKLIVRRHQCILDRCYCNKHHAYKNYGGRGIIMCAEWKNDFVSFFNWCIENGFKKDLDIDRIDNNGNYEPDNCRFVTRRENTNNRRNTILIEIDGVTNPLSEWADISGLNYGLLLDRLDYGWGVKDLLMPVKKLNTIDINGVTKPVVEWAKIHGINPRTINHRIQMGWSTNELFLPVKKPMIGLSCNLIK